MAPYLPATGIWSVAFVGLNIVLLFPIFTTRVKYLISIGDGAAELEAFTRNTTDVNHVEAYKNRVKQLAFNVRAHANFIENVPLAIIVVGVAELNGIDSQVIHGLFATLFLARLMHWLTLSNVKTNGSGAGRAIGVTLTLDGALVVNAGVGEDGSKVEALAKGCMPVVKTLLDVNASRRMDDDNENAVVIRMAAGASNGGVLDISTEWNRRALEVKETWPDAPLPPFELRTVIQAPNDEIMLGWAGNSLLDDVEMAGGREDTFMQTEDYSDAFTRKRVWTGPNKTKRLHPCDQGSYPPPLAKHQQQQHHNTTDSYHIPLQPPSYIPSSHPMHPRVRGSTSNSVSLNSPDRIFRKPTGASLGVNFSNSVNSFYDLAQSLPPFPAGMQGMVLPLPHNAGRRKLIRYGAVSGTRTRLRHSSLIRFEDSEGGRGDGGDDHAKSVLVNTVEPQTLVCSDVASIVNSIATSTRKTIIDSNVGKPTANEANNRNAEHLTSPPLQLFKRPQLNAKAVQDRDFLKVTDESVHNSWNDNDDISGYLKESILLEDILFAFCIARLMPLVSIIPTYSIPRFLNTLLPILMTHHTAYIDPATLLESWGLPSRFFFTPLRIISSFGISWCALSSYNTDSAASTAFVVFIVMTRVAVFIQTIVTAVLDKRANAGWILLRRCAMMVWFPAGFMIVAGLVVQRWVGWRDVMWAAGGVGEVLVVWIIDVLERKEDFWKLKKLAWRSSRNGRGAIEPYGDEDGQCCLKIVGGWNRIVRKRMMGMVALLLGAVGVLSLWPVRLGVSQVDAVVGVQFILGPFVITSFGIVLLYGVHWSYLLHQQSPPETFAYASVSEKFLETLASGIQTDTADLLKWNKRNSLRVVEQQRQQSFKGSVPTIVSGTPAYALLWRLLHLPIYACIVLMGTGIKTIIQDLLNEWLGLAGFNPTPPKNLNSITPASSAAASIDYYINAVSASNQTFTPTSFSENASFDKLWDFTTPKVWITIGLAGILVFSNISSLVSVLSSLKMQSVYQKCVLYNTRVHPVYQSIMDEDCGVNTLIQKEPEQELGEGEDQPSNREIDKSSLRRNPSQKQASSQPLQSCSIPIASTGFGIGKTQSMVNFAAFNNRTSRQSFPATPSTATAAAGPVTTPTMSTKTPTPSILGIGGNSTNSFRGSITNIGDSRDRHQFQITALENDDKFWRELLESSPHGSKSNSIASLNDEEEREPPKPVNKTATQTVNQRHVSINLDSVVRTPLHRRLHTAASVTEDKTISASKAKHESNTNEIFETTLTSPPTAEKFENIVGKQSGKTQLLKIKNNIYKPIWTRFLTRLMPPAFVLGLVPACKYLVPFIAPIVGNLGNAIDISTIGENAEDNGTGVIDGAGWKIVENVEGLIVMCGCTLLLLVCCVVEEAANVIEINRWKRRADGM
ncbi:UNVERIFIED_CONTAM: hypothetical protein HDU68_004585 [Siphonaria sp. JEL0065]|nr:hypothetical protein HDU68_004585 [Siphonaria sp. JEL0065]